MMGNFWNVNSLAHYRNTEEMGLGVFASRPISARQEILKDPIRTFTGSDTLKLRETEAYHILFVDRDHYTTENKKSPLHFAVGPISIVNHSDEPNCKVVWDFDVHDTMSSVALIATKDILPGDEFFISYHNIQEYNFHQN